MTTPIETARPVRPSIGGTIRGVLFEPRRWFSDLSDHGAARAVVIALLVHALVDPLAALGMNLLEPVPVGRVAATIASGPLSAFLQIYVQASIVWVLARAFRIRRAQFGVVVQCLAYAQLTCLIGVVPVIGPIIAVIWYLPLCAIGLRAALRVSWASALCMVGGGPAALVALAVGARAGLVEAFKIPTAGMTPTLMVEDHIFVSKLAYGLAEHRVPGRGHVVVFASPERPEQDHIERVIGLPGDEIVVRRGTVHINGWPIPSCVAGWAEMADIDGPIEGVLVVEFLDDQAYLVFHTESAVGTHSEQQGPYLVSPGQIFVLGDNRERSYDSRTWFGGRGGGVPVEHIRGRAKVIWISFNAWGGPAWSRMGKSFSAPPVCPDGVPNDTCAGLTRCLENRPPVSATTPPAP